MKRAAPMSPDERRTHIIDAVIPLLIEQGTEIPTSAIARAAGIAEGTIFRVFDTKEELIRATIHQALRPDAVIAELGELPGTQTLEERVAAILAALDREITRTRTLFSHIPKKRPSGEHPRQGHRHRAGPPRHVVENQLRLSAAVEDALEQYRSQLAAEPATVARLLSAVAFANRFTAETSVDDPTLVAELLLGGIARSVEGGRA